MILFTHPTGTANVRHAALALHRAGLLGEFWTSIHYEAPTWLGNLLPKSVREKLLRRSYPQELHKKIVARPVREATRLLARRVGLGALTRNESGVCSVDAVGRSLDRQVAQRMHQISFDGVYAYEDSAEYAFRAAKELNQVSIYDLPSGYWGAARKLLEEEAQREPAWARTLVCESGGAARTARKDAELGLADVAIVPSTFARRTLDQPGLTRARIAVVPYGAPLPPSEFTAMPRSRADRLRVLFVGSLSQKNGLSYLFAALRQLGSAAELTVIGKRPSETCPTLDSELFQVRHIASCTHTELLRHMAQHDVFVYPSLFDGFGAVMLEAMSMGLPLIATPNTAAPDLITEGIEGHIVPIRSSQAIAERLEALHRDPEKRAEMGRRAALRARDFAWRRYETTLATRVLEALSLAGHRSSPSFSQPTPDPQLPGVFPRQAR